MLGVKYGYENFLIFLFLFAQLQSVQAIIWDKRFSLKEDTNQIKVLIVDEATDGCWTNLLESKKYVEDKLQLLGGISLMKQILSQ